MEAPPAARNARKLRSRTRPAATSAACRTCAANRSEAGTLLRGASPAPKTWMQSETELWRLKHGGQSRNLAAGRFPYARV